MKLKRALSLAMATLCMGLCLASCKTTLKPGENGLYDEKNDIRYINASTVYEAKELGKEYGVLKLTDDISYKLYTIPEVDPTQMLATEDKDIVYAAGVKIPTLSEMAPTALFICMDTAESVFVIGEELTQSKIDAVVAAYENAPDIPNPGYTPVRNFTIRFESLEHPGFFYKLTYVEYAEDVEIDGKSYGRYFLMSLFDGVYAPVDDTIHNVLGDNTAADTETQTAA